MASEIVTAGIGLVAGVAGSLAAPWAQWGVEQRRLRHQRRVERVAEWRDGIDALRAAEDAAMPPRPFGGGDGKFYAIVGVPERPETPESLYTQQNWYETLSPHLSPAAHASLDQLRTAQVSRRHGKIPDLLRAEVARIERGWKLI